MSILKYRVRMIGALLVFLFVSACGSSSDDKALSAAQSQDSVLRFVSADTPYVFAKTSSVPDDLMDKIVPQMEAALTAYHQIIRAVVEDAYAEARDKDEDVSTFEKWLPFIDDLDSLMSLDGLNQVGFDRDSEFALYGAGLLPVLRISLSDGALLEAEIARIEKEVGEEMDQSTIDGRVYRYASIEEVRIVIAVIDNDLVIAMVPTGFADTEMKQVLGLTLPAENIVEAGTLATIADDYDFTADMIGFIDIERAAATFLDEPSGINADLLGLMSFDNSELSDVCKAEMRSIAAVTPRIVAGYTEFNAQRMAYTAVIEMRQDLAAALPALSGSVPGLGESHGGLLSFGMSFDLLAMRSFYSDRLDALENDPYECDVLQAGFSKGIAEGRQLLNTPAPPVVYGFKGFLAVIDKLEGMDLANGQPPTSVEMRLLIATENAEQLLAMGAMFSPEIAALDIKPDGELVRLELPQIDAMGLIVHAAMTDSALGLAIGDGAEDGLKALLSSSASGSSPVVYMEGDAASYYEMSGQSMLVDVELESIPEIQDAVGRMTEAAAAVTDRIDMSIRLTERGIEIESAMTLHD